MKLESLYNMQQELDDYILSNNDREVPRLFEKTVAALRDELGEYLHEMKYLYAHWKKSNKFEPLKIFEESIDCLHFTLSIGNQLGITPDYNVESYGKYTDQLNAFNSMHLALANIQVCKQTKELGTLEKNMQILVDSLISSIVNQGYSFREIDEEYLRKYLINKERQKNGY